MIDTEETMGLLETAFLCIALWLLFPKGFKYLVGCWVGAISGIFIWGIFVLVWLAVAHGDVSWQAMGWSLVSAISAGIVSGCVLAAHG